MSFQDSLAGQQHQPPPRPQLLSRLLAALEAPNLDAELAAGIRPSVSAAHQARADHLLRRRVRHRVASALTRAVEDASRPAQPLTSQAPLAREAVQRCAGQIRELASLVATLDSPRTRGVAIASQLAFDGCGPLFFQPGKGDGVERLANTLDAAQRALRISPEL
jgi:hypothetical protein